MIYHVHPIYILLAAPFPYQAAKFSSTAPSQSHHLSRAPVAQSARNLAVEPSQAAVIKRDSELQAVFTLFGK